MKLSLSSIICAGLLCLGLVAITTADSHPKSQTNEQQQTSERKEQPAATESVQPKVEKETSDEALEKRKAIIAEATNATDETKKAIKALDDGKTDEAFKALEVATGKLELILARDPKLALAPVDIQVVERDVLADLDTVKTLVEEATDFMEEGEIQKARPLVANLASEIEFRTVNIPLGTYPAAIKAVTPLLDQGKTEEAKVALQTALNTLVVTVGDVIPLPKLRAEILLADAEKLAERKERTEEENKELHDLLKDARTQLKMAEALGYGKQKAFEDLYDQLDAIKEKTAGGKGGEGWFENVKQQISSIF